MILDIIILIIFVISAICGYKKGLSGILVSVIGVILAIVLGFTLQTPVYNYLTENTSLYNTLSDSIENSIESYSNTNNATGSEDNTYLAFVSFITNDESSFSIKQQADVISTFIFKGISFVIVFGVVFLICYILGMILNLVFSLPLLDVVNNFGGLGVNLALCLIKVWIVLAIVMFISPIPIFEPVVDIIEESTVTKTLYDNNIFVNIIKSNVKI